VTLGIEEGGYAQGSLFWIINNINFQYFSILITIVSAIVMIVVSHVTRKPDYDRLNGLTFGTITDEHRAATQSSWDWRDIAASAIVLSVIIGGYLYFVG
jgi:SSS family solute:Na+ symporter